jgi:hypothetical protein
MKMWLQRDPGYLSQAIEDDDERSINKGKATIVEEESQEQS